MVSSHFGHSLKIRGTPKICKKPPGPPIPPPPPPPPWPPDEIDWSAALTYVNPDEETYTFLDGGTMTLIAENQWQETRVLPDHSITTTLAFNEPGNTWQLAFLIQHEGNAPEWLSPPIANESPPTQDYTQDDWQQLLEGAYEGSAEFTV